MQSLYGIQRKSYFCNEKGILFMKNITEDREPIRHFWKKLFNENCLATFINTYKKNNNNKIRKEFQIDNA